MDIFYFLRARTNLIRQFYAHASVPFVERKRMIEAGEPPFVPPYTEDSEPAFEQEWSEADDSLDVLGQMCVSMLAAALQLYLRERISECNLPVRGICLPEQDKKTIREAGWFGAYRKFFKEVLLIRWEDSGRNPELIEQIVLARNTSQHPQRIDALRTRPTKRDLERYPLGFFIDDFDRKLREDPQWRSLKWFPPSLEITREKLFAALDEVEAFCIWLDEQPLHVPVVP